MNKENSVENPNTAIASETETEPTSSKQTTPVKKRKRHKRSKKFKPNFKIPGVHKIVLNEETQHAIGCIAGDNVTAEKPWMNVDKDAIIDALDSGGEASEFFPLKQEITDFPGSEFLMGYIPDESKDYDEFYICVTPEAIEAVNEIVDKLRRIQEEKLENAINRPIQPWKSLGSEKEVEEAMIKVNRSLIEVEIESKYPILPFKIQFRLIKTEDLRDGYMELRPTDESSTTLYRKRIDAFVQVAPSVVSNEAQTVCTYPKNSYTQYEYEIPTDSIDFEGTVKLFEDYVRTSMDSFCDILKVNGCIDLYLNDYENLVLNPKFTVKITLPETKEYLYFIDMNLCGGKMISCINWHPIWTGCVIASYVEIAPAMYLDRRITTDEVHKAVHDSNPVLFWSFTDDLKPKLILETPRPVYAVSCCPYDENLIIGGCVNGQIIIWDITNKLSRVEEEEILTVDQQKYRAYMHSLMNWMKNIFDLALIRPTAISDLKYSHKGCVNSITWMSPFHTITKTGKIEQLEEDKGRSLQLLTSGEDGAIMVWDLLKKPVVAPGGFKAIRKMRRLKKKPSALLVEESPFKKLHLNLKPVYKIILTHVHDNRRLLSISYLFTRFFETEYELVTRNSRKNLKMADRLTYKPVLHLYKSNPRLDFFTGTMEGHYIHAMWEGQEFDSGEIVNYEESQFLSYGNVHDGPVVGVDYSPMNNTILSVGGKIFAFWREDFPNRPLIWRKGKSLYTNGSWFYFEQSSIKLVRMDGYFEIWSLFYKSKSPLDVKLCSNGAVTNISTLPRRIKHNVLAFADYRGSLRMFYMRHQSPLIVKAKVENMSNFLTSEVKRKKDFLKWQEAWTQKYTAKIETKIVEEEKPVITEQAPERRRREEKKVTKISPGQRYLEVVREQHRVSEQARIKAIILKKKQLDTEVLLKQREPLRKLEEENEVKKRKQKNKLKESDQIFKETVAMLFPDVVKEKPPSPPDPYADYYSEEVKRGAFGDFKDLAVEAQDYVEEHPFSYDFSWANVLKTGRERRKKLDNGVENLGHKKRYFLMKEEKARQIAAAETAALEKKSGSGVIKKRSSSVVKSKASVGRVSSTLEETIPEDE